MKDENKTKSQLIAELQQLREAAAGKSALREDEISFSSFFDSSIDAMGISVGSTPIAANDALLRMFGYASFDEIKNKSILDLIAPIDRSRIMKIVKQRAAGEAVPAKYEAHGLKKDGTEFVMDVHISSYKLGGEVYNLSILRDITRRKEAERALLENEERFRLLIESIREIFWIQAPRGEKFHYISPVHDEIWGVSRQAVYDNPTAWLENVVDEDRKKLEAVCGIEYPPDATVVHLPEYRVQRPDGSIRWIESRAYPIRDEVGNLTLVAGVSEDITERKEVEQALQESEQQLQNIFGAMTEGIVVIAPDGEITQANPAAQSILGLTRSEIKDRSFISPNWEVIRPDGSPMPPEEMAGPRAMTEKQPVMNVEMGIRRSDRSVVWINVNAVPQFDDYGELESVVGTFTDITVRKQAETALKLNEDRLEALLRLGQMTDASEKELIDHSLEEGVRLTKSSIGYLHFMHEDRGALELFTWSKEVMKECAAEKTPHYPLEHAGVWADCVRQRQPVIHNDYQNLKDKKGYPQGHSPIFRHMSIPVFDGDDIVAVVGVGNKEEAYDESDVRQLSLFMNSMWQILKRQRVEQALSENVDREKSAKLIFSELNNFVDLNNSLKTIIGHLKTLTGCEAVSVRLHEDGDYPYYAHDGFADTFIRKENSLCARDDCGNRLLDPDGKGYLLECMCGNIIHGKTDSALPFFTENGSFWSNHTSALLASTTEEDRQSRTRNYCNSCGYESVALIPIKYAGECIGLIQLNDKRTDMFDEGLIEYLEMIGEQVGTAVQNNLIYEELKDALANVKTLKGLLPICASCKKIRDDKGYWNRLEEYIHERTDADFTHGVCPDCAEELYPEVAHNHSHTLV